MGRVAKELCGVRVRNCFTWASQGSLIFHIKMFDMTPFNPKSGVDL